MEWPKPKQVAHNCCEYDELVREPSIFNLGHAYRKKRDFANSALWYRASLAINPRIASTYSALGFTVHLSGNLDAAIELYHQSLSLKPDDTFTCEMLSAALRDVLELRDPTVLANPICLIDPLEHPIAIDSEPAANGVCTCGPTKVSWLHGGSARCTIQSLDVLHITIGAPHSL